MKKVTAITAESHGYRVTCLVRRPITTLLSALPFFNKPGEYPWYLLLYGTTNKFIPQTVDFLEIHALLGMNR